MYKNCTELFDPWQRGDDKDEGTVMYCVIVRISVNKKRINPELEPEKEQAVIFLWVGFNEIILM